MLTGYMSDAPLILTLALDTPSQSFFNDLRKQHFPPERNYLDAHLTLFHHLPPNEPQIMSVIESCCKSYSPLQLKVTDVVGIGNGVAFKVENASLQLLHKNLQQQWKTWLIPQDQQKLWPHITIQNKVAPANAKLLKEQLLETFTPFEITGTGLNLYKYLGGPWQFIKFYEFA